MTNGDSFGWLYLGLILGIAVGYLAGRFDKAWFRRQDSGEKKS